MKLTAKGKAVDLAKEAVARSARRERARSLLKGTLPWRVNVQFLNKAGEVVCEWDTGLTLDDWRNRVTMEFCPDTDIEALDE